VAAGPYAGALRELLLAYKERGRHGLARPLGDLLARVVAEAVGGPVLLVPVPSTARAARARYGDHLTRLTRHAEAGLRRAGRSVVVARPVRAVPRPDSAGLDSAARAALAAGAFQPRAGGMARLPSVASGRSVVLLDDIVTTGATLAGLSRILAGGGVRVDAAAVLAGTVRRHPG
jgi:predicted amidophosphoribosyltransferase